MADNTELNLGSGGDIVATDDIAGVKHQRVKIEIGTDGAAADVHSGNPLPVTVATLPLPTGAAAETTLSALNGKMPTQGQALAAASVPVVLPVAQITTLTPPAAITNFAAETGGNLASIKTKTDNIPALGQALAAASVPVILPSATITTLTPPAAITNFANETGGNLASIKAKTDNIPPLGQAVAGSSVPVILPSATITTLTPPAAITGFALDSHLTDGTQKALMHGVSKGATGALDATVSIVDADHSAVDVYVRGGTGSGGTAMTDDSPFTPGSTSVTPAAGTYRATRDAVDDADAGALAMTAKRALLICVETPNGDSAMDDTTDAVKVNVVAGGAGDGAILDGVSSAIKATVLDFTNSNPLAVRLTDTNGDYVGAGAGTQYTEDAPSATDPTGTQLIARRRDSLSTETTTDGDVTAVNCSGKGELYVANAILSVIGPGTEATAQRVTIANDSTGVISVDDNNGSLTIDASSLPLPTGAATETTLAAINTKTPAVGQAAMAASMPVVIANNQSTLPVDASGSSIEFSGNVSAITNYIIPGTTAYALGKAEDVQHVSGDTGVMMLAVRQDTRASFCGTNGDYAPPQLNVSGDLRVDGSAVTQPISGTVTVGAITAGDNNIGNVDIVTVPVPLSTTDGGTEAAALRVTIASDSTGVLSIDDNDSSITVDGSVSLAAAIPAGTNAIGKLAANSGIDIGDVDVTSVIPGTGATNLGKAIDSPAQATDTGIAPLAIRDDALSTLTPAEGDYVPLRVNSTGALHVTGGGGGTEYTVDDPAPTNPIGGTVLVERDDALSTLTEPEADWTNLRANARGAAWVAIDGTVAVPVKGTGTAGSPDTNVVTVQGIANGTVISVDTELPQVTTLGDAASAAPTTPTIGAVGLVMNASTLDRQRAVVAGMDTIGTGIAAAGLVGQFDDASPSTVTENQFAPVRISTRRALLVEGVASGTAQPISGSVTVVQPTGTNLHAVLDATSTTAVTQPTGTNLHCVLDTTSTTAVTQGTATNLKAEIVGPTADNASNPTAKLAVLAAVANANAPTRTEGCVVPLRTNLAGDIAITLDTEQVILGASTAAIGKLTANNGVDIGDVDVTSLPTLPTGANTIGNVGCVAIATGGATPYSLISAATTNATCVKASAGKVYGYYLSNNNAAVRYVKFYNKASAPTVGTDTPIFRLMIPGGSAANLGFETGIAFSTGIAFATTTGYADSDTGAVALGDMLINLVYL